MNQAEHDVDKEKYFAEPQGYIQNSRRYELEADAMGTAASDSTY